MYSFLATRTKQWTVCLEHLKPQNVPHSMKEFRDVVSNPGPTE